MATRRVLKDGEETLRKISRPVKEVDKHTKQLLDAEIRAKADGLADSVIHMPFFDQVFRMAVIGDKNYPLVIWRFAEVDQRFQILRGGPFPDHDPLSPAHLFDPFRCIRTFVIGLDPGSDICVQGFPAQIRCVAVNDPACRFRVTDLFEQIVVSVDQSGGVHDFCQPDDPGPFIIRFKGFCIQDHPGFFQR